MTPRPTSAAQPQAEQSAKSLSRLERVALAHKNAVAEKERLDNELATARGQLDKAERAFHEATLEAMETGKQLTAAALGKPE